MIALYRSIQTDLPCFHQLHDGQCGKGFAGRTKDEGSMRSHRLASWVGHSESLEVNDLVAPHDAERGQEYASLASAR